MPRNRRYTVRATWQSGETKTLGFVREGRAEAYAAHAHRFGAAVTLTDTETGVVLLELDGPFPVALPPERPQQRLESFEWGGPMGGVKTDVFAAGASDFAAEWIDQDGNRRLGGFIRFTGSQPGGTTIGGSSLIYRYTVSGADKASIDTGVDTPDAGSNDWTNGDLLEIWFYARTDEAVTVSNVNVNVNNDTSAIYDLESLASSTAAVSAGAAISQAAWNIGVLGASAGANQFTTMRFSFPNYLHTTGTKVGDLSTGHLDTAGANYISNWRILQYRSTTALSRLAIAPGTAGRKLKIGTQLLIYKRVAS